MPRKAPSPKALYWCYTIWKTDAGKYLKENSSFNFEYMKSEAITQFLDYTFWSVEKGSKSKNLNDEEVPVNNPSGYHLQGFLKCKVQRDLVWLKKNIHSTAHWSLMRATVAKNIDYCSKRDTHISGPYEFGERPAGKQGNRSDIQSAIEVLKETQSLDSLIERHPDVYVKYTRGIESVCQRMGIDILGPKRHKRPYVILVYGDPSCGKSGFFEDYFYEWFAEPSDSTPNTLWVESYRPYQPLMIDEFGGSTMTVLRFKKLINRCQFTLYPRGGVPQRFNGDLLVITSNYSWQTWWPNAFQAHPEDFQAVNDRLNTIWKFTKDPSTGVITRHVERGITPQQVLEKYRDNVLIDPNAEPEHLFIDPSPYPVGIPVPRPSRVLRSQACDMGGALRQGGTPESPSGGKNFESLYKMFSLGTSPLKSSPNCDESDSNIGSSTSSLSQSFTSNNIDHNGIDSFMEVSQASQPTLRFTSSDTLILSDEE